MENKNKKIKTRYFFINQGVVKSIIIDTYTFGILMLFLVFNNYILDGAWYITIFILFCWLVFFVGRVERKKNTFSSIEELIEYLQNEKKQ